MKKGTFISGMAFILLLVCSCEPESLETNKIYQTDSFSDLEIIEPMPGILMDSIPNPQNLDPDTGNQGNPIDDDKEDKG